MKLVIIAGATSTGKTTLAHKLAKDLQLPAFFRDEYKEREFDKIPGRPNLKQLARIENDSYQELYKAVQDAVARDTSLLVEANLRPVHGRKLKSLLRPNAVVVEVFCHAHGFTKLQRYIKRWRHGDRHRGHRDYLWYPIVSVEALGLSKLNYRPLKLSPNVLAVDTNQDFARQDYAAIRRFIDAPQPPSH